MTPGSDDEIEWSLNETSPLASWKLAAEELAHHLRTPISSLTLNHCPTTTRFSASAGAY